MYLETVVDSERYGTISNFIGPFTNKEERDAYRKEWQEVLGGRGALVINRNKLPKGKKATPLKIARFVLLMAKIARDLQ